MERNFEDNKSTDVKLQTNNPYNKWMPVPALLHIRGDLMNKAISPSDILQEKEDGLG